METSRQWRESEADANGPNPSEPWEPPSHRARSQRRRNLALVVAAVVVVVILAITGSLPGIPGILPTVHHPTNGLSFDSARPIADSLAEKLFGSAQLTWAIGIANNQTYVNALENLTESSCPVSGGSTARFVIPAEEGNLTVGLAPAWVFWYVLNPYTIGFVGVVNTSAVYYGQVSHQNSTQGCIGVFQGPFLTSDTIDSSKAATIAAPEATIFARSHFISMVLYIVQQLPANGGGTSGWQLYYESCSFGVSEPGYDFFMALNGTTGTSTGSLTSPVDCPQQVPSDPFP